MQRTLTALVAAALLVSAGMIGAGLFIDRAAATSGGTDKYGGHTPSEKSATKKHPAGVYHCHGTGAKRQVCDMRARVKAQQDRINRLEIEASARTRELAAALKANSKLERETAKLRRDLQTARGNSRHAMDKWAAAAKAKESAIRDMREAEARARGSGPAVSSRCKDGVHAAIDSGWRFSAAEKEALRKACLY